MNDENITKDTNKQTNTNINLPSSPSSFQNSHNSHNNQSQETLPLPLPLLLGLDLPIEDLEMTFLNPTPTCSSHNSSEENLPLYMASTEAIYRRLLDFESFVCERDSDVNVNWGMRERGHAFRGRGLPPERAMSMSCSSDEGFGVDLGVSLGGGVEGGKREGSGNEKGERGREREKTEESESSVNLSELELFLRDYSTLSSPVPLAPAEEASQFVARIIREGKVPWKFYWETAGGVGRFEVGGDGIAMEGSDCCSGEEGGVQMGVQVEVK